jgi:hypothetical protein
MRILPLFIALLLLGCSGASSESRPADTIPVAAETETETETEAEVDTETETEVDTETEREATAACQTSPDCDPGYHCVEGTCTKARTVIKVEERVYDFEDDSIDGDLVKPDAESLEPTEGAVDDM